MTRVVAIDGPAGAGKSTIARSLARELAVPYLDTGAMYRAVTYAVLRDGLDPRDQEAVVALATRTSVEVGAETIAVDGHDVTALIRQVDVTQAVSFVAAISGVRNLMRDQQRNWVSAHGGGVVEGRDIGTVVFPDATLKVFLTASPRVRAERRVAQTGGDVEEISRMIAERDHLDSTRDDSPLVATKDYVVVDTSDMDIAAVVQHLIALVHQNEVRDHEQGR
jgi:cytidylate kinase